MEQPTFSDLEYKGKKRKTRRELFLERMDGLIPWRKLEERIRPFYPKAGRGRHPYPLPGVSVRFLGSSGAANRSPPPGVIGRRTGGGF